MNDNRLKRMELSKGEDEFVTPGENIGNSGNKRAVPDGSIVRAQSSGRRTREGLFSTVSSGVAQRIEEASVVIYERYRVISFEIAL